MAVLVKGKPLPFNIDSGLHFIESNAPLFCVEIRIWVAMHSTETSKEKRGTRSGNRAAEINDSEKTNYKFPFMPSLTKKYFALKQATKPISIHNHIFRGRDQKEIVDNNGRMNY